ncbi:hypothetical protein HBB16_17970 [Pseudonocardia sp. MCCB 268]|nr:hypothetical protein [Pseudonocardia cytotoxica]
MITVSELVAARHLKLSVRACPDRLGEWIRRGPGGRHGRGRRHAHRRRAGARDRPVEPRPPEIDRFVCALARRRASALVDTGAAASTTPDDVIGACERWRLP